MRTAARVLGIAACLVLAFCREASASAVASSNPLRDQKLIQALKDVLRDRNYVIFIDRGVIRLTIYQDSPPWDPPSQRRGQSP